MNLDVYRYVKDLFYKNFPESYLIFRIEGKVGAQEKFSQVIQKIISKYDNSKILSGEYDRDISKVFTDYIREYFTENQSRDCRNLYDYIKNFLFKQKKDIDYSQDIFDHIIKLCFRELWPIFQTNITNIEELDNRIMETYEKIVNYLEQQKNQISSAIDKVCDDRYTLVDFKNIDYNEMKKSVTSGILLNGERELLIKLVDGNGVIDRRTGDKVSEYINQYIRNSKLKHEEKTNENERNIALDDFIKGNQIDKIDSSKIERFNVDMEAPSMVDERIYEYLKENSIKKDYLVEKISVTERLRKIPKPVITLALLAVLSIGSIGSVRAYNNKVNEKYASIVTTLDFTKKTPNYHEMAAGKINYFKELDELTDNQNYSSLAVYKTYSDYLNSRQEKNSLVALGKMEEYFRETREELKENETSPEFSKLVKANSQELYCFLDFVYDRLEAMGFKEISTKGYQDVLVSYKHDRFGNYYGVLDPMSQKEVEVVKIVMDKYEEYSKKYEIEFGKQIAQDRENATVGRGAK